MVDGIDPALDAGSPEVPIFARAILIGQQHDAIKYLDMRIAQMLEAGDERDADFWSAVRIEAKRQMNAGEWYPA